MIRSRIYQDLPASCQPSTAEGAGSCPQAANVGFRDLSSAASSWWSSQGRPDNPHDVTDDGSFGGQQGTVSYALELTVSEAARQERLGCVFHHLELGRLLDTLRHEQQIVSPQAALLIVVAEAEDIGMSRQSCSRHLRSTNLDAAAVPLGQRPRLADDWVRKHGEPRAAEVLDGDFLAHDQRIHGSNFAEQPQMVDTEGIGQSSREEFRQGAIAFLEVRQVRRGDLASAGDIVLRQTSASKVLQEFLQAFLGDGELFSRFTTVHKRMFSQGQRTGG